MFSCHLTRPKHRLLVVPKVLYFLQNAAVYASYTYMPNYFKHNWNIPIYEYGYFSSLGALSFLGTILSTLLADRTGRHRLVLVVSAILYAAFFVVMVVGEGYQHILNDALVHGAIPLSKRTLFIIVTFGGANFFASALFPLLDNRVLVMLEERSANFATDKRDSFGRQRLWGTLGQVFATVANGYGIHMFGYASMFVLIFLFSLLFAILCALTLPNHSLPLAVLLKPSTKQIQSEKSNQASGSPLPIPPLHNQSRVELPGIAVDNNNHSSDSSGNNSEEHVGNTSDDRNDHSNGGQRIVDKPSLSKAMIQLLTNFDFVLFLFVVLVAGCSRAIVGNFLSSLFIEVLGQNSLLFSLALQTRLITELSLFFFSEQLLSRFGVLKVLAIAQLAGSLRPLIYFIMPTTKVWSYVIFPAELLKGVNSACLVLAGVRMAHNMAPLGCEATAQGFFSGVTGSLATAISGVLGGWFLHQYYNQDLLGLKYLFGLTAMITAGSLLLFILKYYVLDVVILHKQAKLSDPSNRNQVCRKQ